MVKNFIIVLISGILLTGCLQIQWWLQGPQIVGGDVNKKYFKISSDSYNAYFVGFGIFDFYAFEENRKHHLTIYFTNSSGFLPPEGERKFLFIGKNEGADSVKIVVNKLIGLSSYDYISEPSSVGIEIANRIDDKGIFRIWVKIPEIVVKDPFSNDTMHVSAKFNSYY